MANCNKAPKAITFGSRVWHTIKLLVLGLIEVAALVVALYPVINTKGGFVQNVTDNPLQVFGGALLHIFFAFMFARCRTNWKLRKVALANYVPEEEVVEEEVVLSKKEAKKAAKEAKKAAKAAKKAKKEEVEEEVEEEVKAPVTNYPQITIIEYDPDEE